MVQLYVPRRCRCSCQPDGNHWVASFSHFEFRRRERDQREGRVPCNRRKYHTKPFLLHSAPTMVDTVEMNNCIYPTVLIKHLTMPLLTLTSSSSSSGFSSGKYSIRRLIGSLMYQMIKRVTSSRQKMDMIRYTWLLLICQANDIVRRADSRYVFLLLTLRLFWVCKTWHIQVLANMAPKKREKPTERKNALDCVWKWRQWARCQLPFNLEVPRRLTLQMTSKYSMPTSWPSRPKRSTEIRQSTEPTSIRLFEEGFDIWMYLKGEAN